MFELHTYMISGIILVLILICFIISFLFISHKKHLKYILEKQNLIKGFEIELAQSQIELQNIILIEISQEIHDNIGQLLSLASITLENITTSDSQKKEQTSSLLNESIASLRNLSKTLHPERLEKIGIGEAIKSELEKLSKTDKYKTSFNYSAYPSFLNSQQILVLFRILQEALQNIIKHANASKIDVAMEETNNYFLLSIEDNGKGFDVTNSLQQSGSGLKNISKRVKAIGGNLEIKSLPGKGTTIQIFIDTKISDV